MRSSFNVGMDVIRGQGCSGNGERISSHQPMEDRVEARNRNSASERKPASPAGRT